MPQSTFYRQLLLLTLGCVAVLVLAKRMDWFFVHPHAYYILAYNAGLAVFHYWMGRKGAEKGGLEFSNYVQGATAVRLLLSLFLLIVYFVQVKENKISFAATFFAFYFLYMLFDIAHLLPTLRANSPKQHEN